MARAHHETAIQAEIVKDLRKEGMFSRKLSHSALVGIPDLIIGHNGKAYLTEVKLTDNWVTLKHGLTVPQRTCLVDYENCGLPARVLVVCKKLRGVSEIAAYDNICRFDKYSPCALPVIKPRVVIKATGVGWAFPVMEALRTPV